MVASKRREVEGISTEIITVKRQRPLGVVDACRFGVPEVPGSNPGGAVIYFVETTTCRKLAVSPPVSTYPVFYTRSSRTHVSWHVLDVPTFQISGTVIRCFKHFGQISRNGTRWTIPNLLHAETNYHGLCVGHQRPGPLWRHETGL